eukprot:TRINITY_DN8952_c0_g1_i1.p1 TRINITY_DN8952_c0_g1~~TRINITY_DN8952_c0_g1_i1.p1  ORF type:complete len:388 (-),score=102.40 TRINITY_DN8952_c0_g1_i1:134-1297(-)
MNAARLLVCVCVVLTALAALCSSVGAAPSTEYWGNAGFGCSETSDGKEAEYNAMVHSGELFWLEIWTLTFAHDTLPVGGMINTVFAEAAGVSAAVVNPFLTDGTQTPPVLMAGVDLYPGRALKPTPDGGYTITRSPSPSTTVQHTNGTARITGFALDAQWDLTVEFVQREGWCTAEHATTQIGIPRPQWLSWRFYNPRGRLSGSVTINGVTHQVSGFGEMDHPYGQPKNLETWSAAYLSNGYDTFYWVDFNKGSGSFARFEGAVANTTFSIDEIEWRVTPEQGNPTRPFNYTLSASNADFELRAQWQPQVPGLVHDGTVQDIMFGEVLMCRKDNAVPCSLLKGNGWTELIVLGGGDKAPTPAPALPFAVPRMPLAGQRELAKLFSRG